MSRYLKAIFATVYAFFQGLVIATVDGHMTLHKWAIVGAATALTGATIWAVPNQPPASG